MNHYQRRWQFLNGYGASVIRHSFSYGHEKGLYELAVLKNNELCYDTKITDNVIGYLTPRDVALLLKQIAKLEKK